MFILLAGTCICLVVISKHLRLTIFLISLGNFSKSSHSHNIKASKFCRSQMESGNFLIFLFPRKLRYLKCFNVPIELDNVSNFETNLERNFVHSVGRYMHLSCRYFKTSEANYLSYISWQLFKIFTLP